MRKLTFIILSVISIIAFACHSPKNEIHANKVKETAVTPEGPSIPERQMAPEKKLEDHGIEIASVDTIRKGDMLIYFKPINNPDFEDYYPDQDKRNSITKNILNSYEKAVAIEDYLKDNFKDIFTASDSTLTLYLENGQELKFPKWDKKLKVGYTFDHYFPEIAYVLLRVHYQEGGAFMLVNRVNGYKKIICGLPHFSQDKRQILTSNVDLEAGYTFNGIGYYQIQADTLVKIFDLDIKHWGPAKIKWTSNKTAIIERTFWTMENYKQIFHTENSTMTIVEK